MTPGQRREKEKEFMTLLDNKDFRGKVVGKLKSAFPASMRSTSTEGDVGILGSPEKIGTEYSQVMAQIQEASRTIGESARKGSEALRILREDSVGLFGDLETGANAYKALSEQMLAFNFMNTKNQQILGNTVGTLSKFGIEMQTTVGIMDSAAMAFGMSQDELASLGAELATIAYKFPGDANKIAQNFQIAQSSLAYDAGKIMTVFKELQAVSSRTGVGFETLTSAFGDSMDTFQGSSDKAGKLNAILGKSIFNSIDLLGKTEAERVETIITGVKNSLGGNVNQLGKFQLKAIADGMGVDVETARRLLSGKMTPDAALKGKKDPRQLLEEKSMAAVEANTMGLKELQTVMKSYVEPFEILKRNQAADSRKFLLKQAQQLGVQNLTSLSEVMFRLMNILSTGDVSTIKMKPEDKKVVDAILSTKVGDVKLDENFDIIQSRAADFIGDTFNVILRKTGLLKEGETIASKFREEKPQAPESFKALGDRVKELEKQNKEQKKELEKKEKEKSEQAANNNNIDGATLHITGFTGDMATVMLKRSRNLGNV